MYCLWILILALLGLEVLVVSGREAIYTYPSLLENRGGCTLRLPQDLRYAPALTNEKTGQYLIAQRPRIPGSQPFIHVNRGEEIRVDCGRGNTLSIHETFYYLRLTCVGGTEFADDEDDRLVLREGVVCAKPRPKSPTIRRNGTCSGKGTNFDVEFTTEDPPRRFYSVCVDEQISGTLYSSSYIDGASFGNNLGETGGGRPNFRGQEFYPFPINQAYKWDNQYEQLAKLLGSGEKVNEYFPTQQYRFSRGHLFPNADGVKRYEKHATFYYINTVPQWQNLNGGNWAKIEQDVRELAKARRRTLNVVTGAYNVTSLLDENNNPVEIWLAEDENGQRRLPVPRFVWKVVHDPATNEAIAIVQINNPWVERRPPASELLCTDRCQDVPWIRSEDFHNPRKGYSYCCDVAELRQVIPYIPVFKNAQLLGAKDKYDSGNDNGEYDSGIESDNDDDESDDGSYSDESDSRYYEGYSSVRKTPSVQKVTDIFASINLGRTGAQRY